MEIVLRDEYGRPLCPVKIPAKMLYLGEMLAKKAGKTFVQWLSENTAGRLRELCAPKDESQRLVYTQIMQVGPEWLEQIAKVDEENWA